MVKVIDRLREGDVIYTDCIDVTFCYHLGIVHHDGDKVLIYHNAPNNHNKFGGSVCAESYDEFIKGRNLLKITKTTATNHDIIRITQKCKHETWDSLFFNCEDYVLEIVEGHRRSDARDAWKIAALGLAILLLI